MSEEEVVVETSTEVEIEPAESKARESGWVGKDEWVEQGHEAGEWVSAEVFNARGELFDKIHRQNREMGEMRKVIDDLKTHQGKLAKAEREKVLAELKRAKATALENEAYDDVVDIDEKIDEVKATKVEQPTTTPGPSPDFTEKFENWKKENAWYEKDTNLREYADAVGVKLAQEGRHYTEIFSEVANKVKTVFPDKFQNPKRESASKVEGASSRGGGKGKSKHSFSDLNEDQQKVAKRFARLGVMSEADYIKQLADAGEL